MEPRLREETDLSSREFNIEASRLVFISRRRDEKTATDFHPFPRLRAPFSFVVLASTIGRAAHTTRETLSRLSFPLFFSLFIFLLLLFFLSLSLSSPTWQKKTEKRVNISGRLLISAHGKFSLRVFPLHNDPQATVLHVPACFFAHAAPLHTKPTFHD